MTTPVSILHFREFEEFYQVLGLQRYPVLPDFDLLTLDNSARVGVSFMPPFRKDWYQLVFKINPTRPVMLNTQWIEPENTLVLFNSPNHVYSWRLDVELRGFVLFFKPNFMAAVPNFEQEFPFFQLTEPNLIAITPSEIPAFDGHLHQMLASSQGNDAYRRQTLQSLLLAFLYRCKSVYQRQQQVKKEQPRSLVIVSQFQQLINSFFLEKKTVAAYAELLNLTPNYFNELVKQTTGKNARHFIVERILTEARNLLRHTTLDINTVAYTLRFDEPTNFVKFFKKHTGLTPGQFRQQG